MLLLGPVAQNGRAVTDYAHIVDFLRYLGCEADAVQRRQPS